MHSEGFEPSPMKNTTWTYRLKPLGHECIQFSKNILIIYTVQIYDKQQVTTNTTYTNTYT